MLKFLKSKSFLSLIAAILFALFLILVFVFENGSNKQDSQSSSEKSEETYCENPIDFKFFKEINPEIYAWIRVPNTNIDYPIAQSGSNDEFYLHHNIYGNYEFSGTVYSEKKHNDLSFMQSNTVLYGHNMTKGYMFENLNLFQDQEFFNNNTEFYIYTPDKILKYTIVSAFQHSKTHVMYEYNLNNIGGFERYIKLVKSPKYNIKNVRDDIKITEQDKLVTLSTCLGSGRYYRYLVVGVLTDIKKTK